jgi:hypothetical protein
MDILNRHNFTDFFDASKSDSAGTSDAKLGGDLRTCTGARLDWEVRCRMDNIYALEEDTLR